MYNQKQIRSHLRVDRTQSILKIGQSSSWSSTHFYQLLDCCQWPVWHARWKPTDWQIKVTSLWALHLHNCSTSLIVKDMNMKIRSCFPSHCQKWQSQQNPVLSREWKPSYSETPSMVCKLFIFLKDNLTEKAHSRGWMTLLLCIYWREINTQEACTDMFLKVGITLH